MNKLYQISSGEHGKQCDFFPHGSIHEDRSKIHFFCDILEVPEPQALKTCPYCSLDFPFDWPFVKPDQVGDKEMCVRCHEKKYVVNRENYHKALRETIMIELKNK